MMATLVSPLTADFRWKRHLVALMAVIGLLFLLFARDIGALAAIWWNSSTYNHCMLILPITGWLVWQRVPELRLLMPRGWVPGLTIVAAGAGCWLLGDAAGVAIARHLGLILMIQGCAISILGPEIARALLFPLFYLFFAVPAGEELVPPLQTLTAQICMALLGMMNIPAHVEGVFITIPNGWFEVAEACSGVKFLVAMAAYSALAANVCFRGWMRRLAFIVAALALPILANGVRAWGTIYIAHLTDTHFANGMDHVIYGWIFFGVVIVLLMSISWRFFDRRIDDSWFDPAQLQPTPGATDDLRGASIGATLIASAAILWSLAAATGSASLKDNGLPDIPGWTRVARTDRIAWQPNFKGADRLIIGRYQNKQGRAVDLVVAVYASQSEGRELVGFGQGAIGPHRGWAWTDNQPAPANGRAFRITGHGGVVRDVVTFYRVGNVTTGSELRVKIETLKAKLTGGPKRAVAIMLSAPEPAADRSARPSIDAMLRALPAIDTLADSMAEG